MHVLWPGELWELIAERTKVYEAGPKTETRRVALFTSFDKAHSYLIASQTRYDNGYEFLPGRVSDIVRKLLRIPDTHDYCEYSKDSLLYGHHNARIREARELPIDPELGD